MYEPKVNDYVVWHTTPHPIEGWVYFVDSQYITIEIGVKEKPDNLVGFHKKTHCCVLCYPQFWHELEYIKSQKSIYEEEDVLALVGEGDR